MKHCAFVCKDVALQNYVLGRGFILQFERTPSSSQWKHCQCLMKYDWCMTFSYMKAVCTITFFPLSPTLVTYCLNSELLRMLQKCTNYMLSYPCSWLAVMQCFSVTLPSIWLALLTEWGMWSPFLDAVSCCVLGQCAYGPQNPCHGCGNGVAFLTLACLSLILAVVGAYHCLSLLYTR